MQSVGIGIAVTALVAVPLAFYFGVRTNAERRRLRRLSASRRSRETAIDLAEPAAKAASESRTRSRRRRRRGGSHTPMIDLLPRAPLSEDEAVAKPSTPNL